MNYSCKRPRFCYLQPLLPPLPRQLLRERADGLRLAPEDETAEESPLLPLDSCLATEAAVICYMQLILLCYIPFPSILDTDLARVILDLAFCANPEYPTP